MMFIKGKLAFCGTVVAKDSERRVYRYHDASFGGMIRSSAVPFVMFDFVTGVRVTPTDCDHIKLPPGIYVSTDQLDMPRHKHSLSMTTDGFHVFHETKNAGLVQWEDDTPEVSGKKIQLVREVQTAAEGILPSYWPGETIRWQVSAMSVKIAELFPLFFPDMKNPYRAPDVVRRAKDRLEDRIASNYGEYFKR